MDKPGRHRTGLNPNFCILTGMSEHLSRDWIGVRGAHAPSEPTPLLVHDADRCRLLRHVQSDIMRHPNLRWCKPPDDNRPDRGTIDGSRPFRDYPRSTPSRRLQLALRANMALGHPRNGNLTGPQGE